MLTKYRLKFRFTQRLKLGLPRNISRSSDRFKIKPQAYYTMARYRRSMMKRKKKIVTVKTRIRVILQLVTAAKGRVEEISTILLGRNYQCFGILAPCYHVAFYHDLRPRLATTILLLVPLFEPSTIALNLLLILTAKGPRHMHAHSRMHVRSSDT